MPNLKALSNEQEEEARRLLASGTTARSIARRFGCDHKTITKLGGAKRTDLPEGEIGEARDEFERAQLAVFERIRARTNARGKKAPSDRDLTMLTKAMNDTVKAIRLHRLLGGKRPEEEQDDRVSDAVIARLRRLAERAAEAPPTLAPVDAATSEEDTGT